MARSLDAPRGAHGFGYDPYFFLPSLNATRRGTRTGGEERQQPSRNCVAAPARAADGGSVIRSNRRLPMSATASSGLHVAGRIRLTSLPPLALYVHFPWCVRKCPYCDFNSHEWKGDTFPENEYLDALRADLEMALPLVWGRQVHTRVHRRRHAQPAVGARGSTACCPTCARCCRSTPTRRSRSKPIPAPSKPPSSRSFARAA